MTKTTARSWRVKLNTFSRTGVDIKQGLQAHRDGEEKQEPSSKAIQPQTSGAPAKSNQITFIVTWFDLAGAPEVLGWMALDDSSCFFSPSPWACKSFNVWGKRSKKENNDKNTAITVVTRCFVIFMLCDTQVSLVDFELQAIDIKICGGGSPHIPQNKASLLNLD